MSNYRSMIDQALETARARAHTPAETVKVASAHGSSLIKEAEEIAGALEFLSMSATGGDKVAAFRQEMIRDFYKAATGNPAQGPTVAAGVQGIAPAEGKTKLAPKGLVGGDMPIQSSAAPIMADGQKPLRESFKQAGSQSLYDVLMGNKTAGMGGPAEYDSETMAGVSTQNENSTYRKTLHTNEGPVNANRRELKKNTRARLNEAFGHTNDTLGDATAAQIFPLAAQRGHLKVSSHPSSVRRRLQQVKVAGLRSAIWDAVKETGVGKAITGGIDAAKNSAVGTRIKTMADSDIGKEVINKVQGLGRYVDVRNPEEFGKAWTGVNDAVKNLSSGVTNAGEAASGGARLFTEVIPGALRQGREALSTLRGAAAAAPAERGLLDGLTTTQKVIGGTAIGGAGLLGVKALSDASGQKSANAPLIYDLVDYADKTAAAKPSYRESLSSKAREVKARAGEEIRRLRGKSTLTDKARRFGRNYVSALKGEELRTGRNLRKAGYLLGENPVGRSLKMLGTRKMKRGALRSAVAYGAPVAGLAAIRNAIEKRAYDVGSGSFQSTRPVYEMTDADLARRLAYEEGETGTHALMGAVGGGLTGALAGAGGGPAASAVGGGLGAAMGGGLGYLSQKLKAVEASREMDRRMRARMIEQEMKGNSKTASQAGAALGGTFFGPPGAALGADDGSRLSAGAGSLAGALGGAVMGAAPGVLAGSPEFARLGGSLGAMAGGGIGGYLGHGREMSPKEKLMRLKMEAELEAAKMRGEA
jgi:hypothetical protein